MTVELTFEDVAAVEKRIVEMTGCEVIPSSDPRRGAVIDLMSAGWTLAGKGWSRTEARERVSLALPALPTVLPTVTRSVPILGDLLGLLGGAFSKPSILLSPAAEATPVSRISALCHEAEHLLQLHDGGIAWCLAYAFRPEHRVLGAEAPCYAANLAWSYWCEGVNPSALVIGIARSLVAYGADDALVNDAIRMLTSHSETLRDGLCIANRTVIEAVRVLRREGVEGLPEVL